jgi:hypothetical protein
MGVDMIPETDRAYIAGLFDGEGSIHFKRGPEKKKKHKGVGTLTKKPRKGKRVDGTPYLMQWRWRCTFRDAYYVCCLIWPWSHTKLEKVQQVIQHYAEQKLDVVKIMNGKVVNLDEYRKAMSLE